VLTYSIFNASVFLLVLNCILALILIVIAVYDIRHTIIPDECVSLLLFLALVLLGAQYYEGVGMAPLIADLAGGIGAAFFFFALWYISKGKWIGLGDAKLALPLGVIAGISGVFSMVVLSFWVGAGISLFLLMLQYIQKRGKTFLRFQSQQLTIKSEVPFAPFLILGFLLVYFFHADIFKITSFLIPV